MQFLFVTLDRFVFCSFCYVLRLSNASLAGRSKCRLIKLRDYFVCVFVLVLASVIVSVLIWLFIIVFASRYALFALGLLLLLVLLL